MSIVSSGEKLILCSGPYVYEGAKTLDANPDYKPDYCVTLPPLPRDLRTGHWAEIYLIHGIEHFYRWEADELLRQCYEALESGGVLVLEQPNIEVAMKVALGLMESPTPKPDASGMYALFGDPEYGNPMMGHKWGWTPEKLRVACVRAGFSLAKVKAGRALSRPFAEGRDFRIEATK